MDFGSGMETGNFKPLHYNMPATFMDLAGRWNFIYWRNNRSEYERNNENIAISFIRYFDISKEEFIEANERFHQELFETGLSSSYNPLTQRYRSRFINYPVDLIFTFDNEAINEFFRWENSPTEHERNRGR